jgi:hypothetical protein
MALSILCKDSEQRLIAPPVASRLGCCEIMTRRPFTPMARLQDRQTCKLKGRRECESSSNLSSAMNGQRRLFYGHRVMMRSQHGERNNYGKGHGGHLIVTQRPSHFQRQE